MKLRYKMILILIVLNGAMLAALSTYVRDRTLSQYQGLERQQALGEAKAVGNALRYIVDNLDAVNVDWASWDDTYAFIEDRNQGYVESNLVDSTFIGGLMDVMLFYDASGNLVHGVMYTPQKELTDAVPSYMQSIGPGGFLPVHSEERTAGFIYSPDGMLLLTARPILTSRGEGPSRGTLVMARYVANTEKDVASLSQSSVEAWEIGDKSAPDDVKAAFKSTSKLNPYEAFILSKDTAYGYCALTDLGGATIAILRVKADTQLMVEAEKTSNSYLIYFLAVGASFSAVTLILVHFMLFKPMITLSRSVHELGSEGDIKKRLETDDSELGDLSRDLNDMLDGLEKARLTETENREKVEELRRSHINDLLDGARRISTSVRFDLRSPLQVIKNASYLLRQDPTRVEEVLDLIDVSVERSVEIIEELNSKTNTGDVKQTFGDVKQLLEQAEKTARIPERIKVVKKLGDDFLAIRLDVSKFERVLLNLISNAVDAIPGEGTITFETLKTDGQLELFVRDTGTGIRPENMQRLFQPFFTTKPNGTGLGLVYCREVIEAHGGSIKVESEPGKGTTVTIVLPLRRI